MIIRGNDNTAILVYDVCLCTSASGLKIHELACHHALCTECRSIWAVDECGLCSEVEVP